MKVLSSLWKSEGRHGIFRKMRQDWKLIGRRKLLDMSIITCSPVCAATEWFDPKQKHIRPHFPFAYVQLSPPAKDSRGAEWEKSKQLVTLSEASHPVPAPPCSGFYTVGSTCPPLPPSSFLWIPWGPPQPLRNHPSFLQGAFKSSPEAGSLLGFLSIRLAFPEVLMTKTGTKEALSGEYRGWMGNVTAIRDRRCYY